MQLNITFGGGTQIAVAALVPRIKTLFTGMVQY